jgi:hypothetical protein
MMDDRAFNVVKMSDNTAQSSDSPNALGQWNLKDWQQFPHRICTLTKHVAHRRGIERKWWRK